MLSWAHLPDIAQKRSYAQGQELEEMAQRVLTDRYSLVGTLLAFISLERNTRKLCIDISGSAANRADQEVHRSALTVKFCKAYSICVSMERVPGSGPTVALHSVRGWLTACAERIVYSKEGSRSGVFA